MFTATIIYTALLFFSTFLTAPRLLDSSKKSLKHGNIDVSVIPQERRNTYSANALEVRDSDERVSNHVDFAQLQKSLTLEVKDSIEKVSNYIEFVRPQNSIISFYCSR
jgi:hypothetical protein